MKSTSCAPFLILATSLSGLAAPTSQTNALIKWSPCHPPTEGPRTYCGTIEVPLDYDEPHNNNISIGLVLVPSTGNSRGSLHFNPGGPGEPATNLALGSSKAFDLNSDEIQKLLENYNLVFADPRGVGRSHPVKCDPEIANRQPKAAATDRESYDALTEWNKDFGDSCARLTDPPGLINHLDTVNVAKDFELVRQALGDEKLNLVGLSYGTQIGYTYAEHYPDRVGRMVLDGVVDHSQSTISHWIAQTVTASATLEQFLGWCKKNITCAFHCNNNNDPKSYFQSVLRIAEAEPIEACSTNFTAERLLRTVHLQLYDVPTNESWANLSRYFLQVAEGDPKCKKIAPFEDSFGYSNRAINCQDWTHPFESPEGIAALVNASSSLTPLTKNLGTNFFTACIHWPAPVTNPQRKINTAINKAPPILMVQSFWDPATSIQGAVEVKAQIPHARLIFRNGAGHLSFFLGGDTTKASIDFLINGTLPEDGMVYNS